LHRFGGEEIRPRGELDLLELGFLGEALGIGLNLPGTPP